MKGLALLKECQKRLFFYPLETYSHLSFLSGSVCKKNRLRPFGYEEDSILAPSLHRAQFTGQNTFSYNFLHFLEHFPLNISKFNMTIC